MKRIGLFFLIFALYSMSAFLVFKDASVETLLKMILATQFTYIVYKLITEED